MNKKAITTSTIKAMKQQGEPITMVTAYDVAMAVMLMKPVLR